MTKLKLNNDVQLTNLKTSKLKNIHYLKFHKFSFRKFGLVTYLLAYLLSIFAVKSSFPHTGSCFMHVSNYSGTTSHCE